MPRSSSSNKPTAKVAAPSRPPVPFQNPYSSVASPVIQASQPTFGQTLKEGLAFGTGSALAHRFFNPFPTSIAPTQTAVQQKLKGPCESERIAFENCLKTKSGEDFCGNEQLSYTECIKLGNNH